VRFAAYGHPRIAIQIRIERLRAEAIIGPDHDNRTSLLKVRSTQPDLLHWRVKDALPVGSSAHTARMVSAIDGALGGVMARALLLPVQSPPLNATDPEMTLDGWQGMRVRKASKQEAEEEAVRNLIALLRHPHAFRSEAISQVEALLDGDRGSAGR
jgi:hypothetical protein